MVFSLWREAQLCAPGTVDQDLASSLPRLHWKFFKKQSVFHLLYLPSLSNSLISPFLIIIIMAKETFSPQGLGQFSV